MLIALSETQGMMMFRCATLNGLNVEHAGFNWYNNASIKSPRH